MYPENADILDVLEPEEIYDLMIEYLNQKYPKDERTGYDWQYSYEADLDITKEDFINDMIIDFTETVYEDYAEDFAN